MRDSIPLHHIVGQGQVTGNPRCHPREMVNGSHRHGHPWDHVLAPALWVRCSNAVIPSLSHLFTFCWHYTQLHDKPQVWEVTGELRGAIPIQVISFMSCIDRKCFLTVSILGRMRSHGPCVQRAPHAHRTAAKSHTQRGLQPEWGLALAEPVRQQGGQRHQYADLYTNVQPPCQQCAGIFCFWECELPGSNIHSLWVSN